MKVLVVGGTGATGRLLIKQLLKSGTSVITIVRSPEKLPKDLKNNKNLTVVSGTVLNLTDKDINKYMSDCDAVISCLGHNLSFKGMYGKPLKLVTSSIKRLCSAISTNESSKSVKVILMNTAGNSNRDLRERLSLGEKLVIGLIRLLLPPHRDNENAADYLRKDIGQDNKKIHWVVVRPDTLINEDETSEYRLFPSPIRSAIFNPGKTSRINVGHFMKELVINNDTWNRWKGKMPVIYNSL